LYIWRTEPKTEPDISIFFINLIYGIKIESQEKTVILIGNEANCRNIGGWPFCFSATLYPQRGNKTAQRRQ
jgi:hypothetical protein